jgi:hypothetical protein
MKRISLFIACVNTVAISLTVAALKFEIVKRVGLLEPVLSVIAIYCMISFFTSVAGIAIGVSEVRSYHDRKLSFLGIIWNIAYLAVYISLIVMVWPVMMGV